MSKQKGKQKRAKRKPSVALTLSETQLVDVRNVFGAFDDDRDQLLSAVEAMEAAEALGARLEVPEGRMLDVEGFTELLVPLIGVDSREQQEMAAMFRLFDEDGKGFITHADLVAIAKELDEGTTEKELLEMIQEADQDGTGMVDIHEFTAIMKYK